MFKSYRTSEQYAHALRIYQLKSDYSVQKSVTISTNTRDQITRKKMAADARGM